MAKRSPLPRNMPIKERLALRSVAQPNGCIIFTGNLNPAGYGRLWVKGRIYYPHRLSYMVNIGPIPAGMCVCHRCDSPPCINPAHLFLGTHADNAADMIQKGRAPYRPDIRQISAKLSKSQAIAIKNDSRSYRQIANDYGISKSLVHGIKSGRNWNHI